MKTRDYTLIAVLVAVALLGSCVANVTPGPLVPAKGAAEYKLTGQYHKDKYYFFPNGRDYEKEALFVRALKEGADGAWYKPDPRYTAEQNLAIEYDVMSFIGSAEAGLLQHGIVLGKVGRWKESVDALRRAAEEKPSDAGTWGDLGAAYHALGRYRESVEAFDKAVLLDPAYFSTRNTQEQIWQASRESRQVKP